MSRKRSTCTILRKQDKIGANQRFWEKRRVFKSSLEVSQGVGILKQNWYLEKGCIVEPLE